MGVRGLVILLIGLIFLLIAVFLIMLLVLLQPPEEEAGVVLTPTSAQAPIPAQTSTPSAPVIDEQLINDTEPIEKTNEEKVEQPVSDKPDKHVESKKPPQIVWMVTSIFDTAVEDDEVSLLDVDNAGNAYIAGQSNGDVSFSGGRRLENDGGEDFFLAKYSATGRSYFLTSSEYDSGDMDDEIMDMYIDGNANLYVSGYSESDIDFSGDLSTENNGGKDFFAVKYDTSGVAKLLLVSEKSSGKAEDFANQITVDNSGNIFVGGETLADIDFGEKLKMRVDDQKDFFVVKYDPKGMPLWIVDYSGGENDEYLSFLETDSEGNLYVAGYSDSDIDFGNGIKLTNNGKFDFFIVKYDASGTALWIATSMFGSGTRDDFPIDIKIFSEDVYLAGSTESDLNFGNDVTMRNHGFRDFFVVKYNSEGIAQWVLETTGSGQGDDIPVAIEIDNGNVVLLGLTTGNLDFNGMHLTNAGFKDFFLVKYIEDTPEFLISSEGSRDDIPVALAVDGGDIYIAGQTRSNLDFNDVKLTVQSGFDFFVVKFVKGKAEWLITSNKNIT